jgi:lipoprotein-anchoring transpeptidase ErfK/SrfK
MLLGTLVFMTASFSIRWVAERSTVLGCFALLAACSREVPDRPPEPPAQAAVSKAAAPKAVAPSRIGAPAPEFKIDTFLQPDRPLKPRDYIWDAEGAPDAPLRIVVDIEAQRLYAYRGGVEIGRSTMIYGADDKATPMGTFPILEKDADHESNLYDAEMPYMLRLTWDGVAIHGSEVEEWAATNGCIGIPDEFAALLFAEARLGDPVLVTNGWMTDIYGT